jgi:hypothetical protein
MALLVLGSILVPSAPSRGEEPVTNTVHLRLLITGLSGDGCTLAIRPSHPGCRFEPVERKIVGGSRNGMIELQPIDLNAVSLGADRDCSFTITLNEPGQPSRIYHRGIRLLPPGPDGKMAAQTVKVYLTSPSLAAREEESRSRR